MSEHAEPSLPDGEQPLCAYDPEKVLFHGQCQRGYRLLPPAKIADARVGLGTHTAPDRQLWAASKRPFGIHVLLSWQHQQGSFPHVPSELGLISLSWPPRAFQPEGGALRLITSFSCRPLLYALPEVAPIEYDWATHGLPRGALVNCGC